MTLTSDRFAFNPIRFEDLKDPYPAYRELRDRAPVHYSPEADLWCVSRYDDVEQVLRSPEQFSSRAMFTMLMNNGREGMPPLKGQALRFIIRVFLQARLNPFEFATARNLIAEDGDRHTKMRNIVNRGFTPRRIASWEKRAEEVVQECMARLRSGESFDVMRDLAIPLPVTVIAEMIGVERERLSDFKRWSDTVIQYTSGPGRAHPFALPIQDAMIEMARYIKKIARKRQRAPRDDLISAIVAQEKGETALTIREVFQFVVLLLVAGNETTTNLIGNAVTALLDHPDELDRAASDPARIPKVLEETLRYDSPIQLVFRKTTEEVELRGTRLPQGANLAVLIGSANRDERRFPEPDRFEPERDTRRHLGFGFGKHFCLGASLARLEARLALEALVPELPRLKRCGTEREMVKSFLVRGPRSLELVAAQPH